MFHEVFILVLDCQSRNVEWWEHGKYKETREQTQTIRHTRD